MEKRASDISVTAMTILQQLCDLAGCIRQSDHIHRISFRHSFQCSMRCYSTQQFILQLRPESEIFFLQKSACYQVACMLFRCLTEDNSHEHHMTPSKLYTQKCVSQGCHTWPHGITQLPSSERRSSLSLIYVSLDETTSS